ncbi:MAG: hypothetical protein OIF57_09635 [Marinobacterium sp.]|nr:hypothetical protein [Marinobacterium sp.]
MKIRLVMVPVVISAFGAVVLSGCSDTAAVRSQSQGSSVADSTIEQAAPAPRTAAKPGELNYQPHPWLSKLQIWHRPDLTTPELQQYRHFVTGPVALAPETQQRQPVVRIARSDNVLQNPFPPILARSFSPRYLLADKQVTAPRMRVHIFLLAAARKPSAAELDNYLPVIVTLKARDQSGKVQLKQITVSASALRMDVMDEASKRPLLSLLDPLDEVKAAWLADPARPQLQFEDVIKHWGVKVRMNLESLQQADNGGLDQAG